MRKMTRRSMLRAAAVAALLPAACADPSAPTGGETDENRWGANTFLHLDSDRWRKQKTLEMAARAGLGWIKQHFPWEDIESLDKGQFLNPTWKHPTWDKYDEIVDLAEENGLKVIARVDRTPAWARPEDSTPTEPPADLDDFGDFVTAIVRRYRGRVRHFQIWNEPNLAAEWGGKPPDATHYVKLLETAFSAAVGVDPETVILAAPLAATLEMSDRARNELIYLQQVYDAGGGDYFHIHSANAFGLAFPPEAPPDPKVLNFRRVELSRALMEQKRRPAQTDLVQRVRLERFPSRLLGQPANVGARHRRPAGGVDSARRGVRPGKLALGGGVQYLVSKASVHRCRSVQDPSTTSG